MFVCLRLSTSPPAYTPSPKGLAKENKTMQRFHRDETGKSKLLLAPIAKAAATFTPSGSTVRITMSTAEQSSRPFWAPPPGLLRHSL